MRSLEDLLPEVVAATLADKLHWQTSNVGPKSYETSLGSYIIKVWPWTDDVDGRDGFSAAISLPGQLFDNLDVVASDEYGPQYSVLQSVYRTAHRSARNVSAIIDELETALDNL